MNDRLLLEQLKKRSKNSIETLVNRYSAYVSTVVYNAIGSYASREDMEEVVQDVFISVWNNIESVNNLKSYIGTAARNTAINKLRGLKYEAELEENTPDIRQNPHSEFERKEMTRILYEEITALGEPDCEIFFRYYYNNERLRDIADETGLNISTIKSKLKRGKEKLSERLSERRELM
ncbi:MAG: sigma-70 family RNA polymerase sigma factor [Clostridia bacterium]|nr:sigma-70 family RNA polymerase sigma factor [Clostridia bacterium]